MTNEEYGRYVDALAPRSKTGKNLLNAFWVGGLICAIGQALLNGYQALGLDETTAGAAVSISLVLLSAILTGFAVYDDIAKFAGAARSCPSRLRQRRRAPAIEFQTEGFVLGTAAKMFTIAGPGHRLWPVGKRDLRRDLLGLLCNIRRKASRMGSSSS